MFSSILSDRTTDRDGSLYGVPFYSAVPYQAELLDSRLLELVGQLAAQHERMKVGHSTSTARFPRELAETVFTASNFRVKPPAAKGEAAQATICRSCLATLDKQTLDAFPVLMEY